MNAVVQSSNGSTLQLKGKARLHRHGPTIIDSIKVLLPDLLVPPQQETTTGAIGQEHPEEQVELQGQIDAHHGRIDSGFGVQLAFVVWIEDDESPGATTAVDGTPTPAGIEEAAIDQGDQEDDWDGDHGIFDQGRVPVILAGKLSNLPDCPGDECAEEPGDQDDNQGQVATVQSNGWGIPNDDEGRCHGQNNRRSG